MSSQQEESENMSLSFDGGNLLVEIKSEIESLEEEDVIGIKWIKSLLAEDLNPTLRRFLRFQDWDLEKTMDSLKKVAAWRHETDPETHFLTWPKDKSEEADLIRNHYIEGVTGKGHDGNSVIVLRLARNDYPGLAKAVSSEKILSRCTWFMEKVSRENPLGKCTFIVDCGNTEEEKDSSPLSFWNFKSWTQSLIKFAKLTSPLSDDFYPDLMKKVWIVRAPRGTMGVWSIIKIFINKKNAKKLSFFSDVPMKELLEEMPISAIPKCLGGESEMDLPSGGKMVLEKISLDE